MKAAEREIRRKRRVLEHAVENGNVAKTCRYFGVPRSSFYRWRNAYQEHGEKAGHDAKGKYKLLKKPFSYEVLAHQVKSVLDE